MFICNQIIEFDNSFEIFSSNTNAAMAVDNGITLEFVNQDDTMGSYRVEASVMCTSGKTICSRNNNCGGSVNCRAFFKALRDITGSIVVK